MAPSTASPWGLASIACTQGDKECYAAWTASAITHEVKINVPDGIYLATSYDGKKQTEVASTNGILILPLDGGPQYLKRQ